MRWHPAGWDEKWRSSSAEVLRLWRQEQAKRTNRPTWSVMKNETLFIIADHEPDTKEALALAGMRPAAIRIYGDSLLALIAQIKADREKRNPCTQS